MYRTQKEWATHMKEPHRTAEIWHCIICNDRVKFREKDQLASHLLNEHSAGVTEAQLPVVIAMSAKRAPPEACPVCNKDPSKNEHDDTTTDALDHIARCIHSFALRSLPWMTDDKESPAPTHQHQERFSMLIRDWLDMISPEIPLENRLPPPEQNTNTRDDSISESSNEETSYFDKCEYFEEDDISTETGQSRERKPSTDLSFDSNPARSDVGLAGTQTK